MMFCSTVSIHAETENSEIDIDVSASKLYDDADLIPDEKEEAVNEAMQELSKKSGWHVIGITGVKDYDQSAMNYAYNYYINIFGKNTNGIAYFVDMENRKVAVTTFGEVRDDISDRNAQEMIDEVKSYLKAKEVDTAMLNFVSSTEYYYDICNISFETTVSTDPSDTEPYYSYEDVEYTFWDDIELFFIDISFAIEEITDIYIYKDEYPFNIIVVMLLCTIFGIITPLVVINKKYKVQSESAYCYFDEKHSKFNRKEEIFTHEETISHYSPESHDSNNDDCGGAEDSF